MYDALNRIKSADYSFWNGSAWTASTAYDLPTITYDVSGNLLTLQRNKETGALIDNVADELGARRFSIPKEAWNRMSASEQWAANQKFLDRAIARGDEILQSNRVTSIGDVSGSLRKELEYLVQKGFRLSEDGTKMIK